MASSPSVERTTGLDLNTGELEEGSTNSGAALVSDTGGEVRISGECLVVRNSEGSGLTVYGIAGCSDAAEMTEGLEIREKKICARSSFLSGREANHTPESRGTETGSIVELDVEAGAAKNAKKVQDEIEPAEFEKSGHEVEALENLKSSLMEKTSAENIAQSGNLLEGRIPLAGNKDFEAHFILADESEAHGKAKMYYKETADVIKTAEAMDAGDPGEDSNECAQFPASETNFYGEKDKFFENEDEAELVEEDTINDEKRDNTLSDSFGCESVGSQLQDKLIVLDSASSGNCVSVGIYKPEISVFDGEHDQEIAETATFSFDGDEVEGTVDTLDPGSIQVEISEIKNQSERKEGSLSKIIELSGDGKSCPENAIQVANDDSADKLDAAKADMGADAMDDSVEVDGTPNQIMPQDGDAIKLPQLCLSTADESEGLQKEVVSHSAINERLHGTEVTVLGSSGQNEGSAHNPSVLTGEIEVFPMDNHNKSPELNGQTDAGESSMLHTAENDTFITEMPNIDMIQNAQIEENPVQQKQLKEVGLGSTDGVENCQLINDKINSDLTNPIAEVDVADKDPLGEYIPDVSFMITTDSDADIDIRVAEADTGDVNLLEEHMTERFSGVGTETDVMEIDRWNMKNNESTAMADVSIPNPPVLMSNNQFVLDDRLNVGDIIFSSSSLVLEAKSSDQDMMIDEEFPKGNEQTLIHAARPEISIEDIGEHVCYYFPSKDEDGFSISDLIWGKVKSHPWWPGQIFDVSDASDLALKYQKKDNFLVAYFGDKTFAWCDESQLKHFEIHFPQLEKQSSSDVFTSAVNGALNEFCRRIELGMTCFCLPEDGSINHKKAENAGVCKGSNGYVLDRPAILSYFEPDKLLEYIKNLAQFPDSGTDRLSLVVANSQLKAFYRSKGYPEQTSFKLFDGIIDCNDEALHLNSESIGKYLFKQPNHVFCDPGEPNAQGLSMHKQILEDGKKQKSLSELMEPEVSQRERGIIIRSYVETDHDSVPFSSSKKHKAIDVDSSDLVRSKKRRSESVGDMEMNLPSSAARGSFKVGEYICRVASQLTGFSSNLRTSNETSLKVCKGDSVYDDFASDGLGDTVTETPSFEPDDLEYDASPNELFLLLHLAARDPTEGYDYLSSVSSFFTKFRNYCAFSSVSKEKHPEEERAEKDKKRKVEGLSAFPEVIEADHMLDSYWSDLMPSDHPTKIKVEAHTPIQRKRRKSSRQTSALVSVPVVQATEHIQIGIARPNMKQVLSSDRPIISVNAKIVNKYTPTALILNFNGSNSLPSETDLIRIFSHYGPIVETAIEVHPKNNSVKVVFRRRSDAEMAFSSAGKYGWFGPSLLSYGLRCLSSTPDTSADIQQSNKCPALPEQSSNFETPGNIRSFMSSALTETNYQNKSTETCNINIIHSPTGNDSNSNLKNTCDAEPKECINADLPNDHPSVSNAYVETNSSNQSELVLTGNGRTDTAVVLHTPDRIDTSVALHTPVSDASPDTGLQMQSDTGITEDSNTGIPCEVHSSVSVSPPDSDLQSQIDAVLVQSSTPNVLCDIHPDNNLQKKSETASDIILLENSYAVVRSTASDIRNELHPSMCEVPLLDNPHGEGDAVTIASRSVASLDSDVPNQSDVVLFDNNNKNCPCDLHPSTYYTSADANLQEKHETVSDITVSDVVLRYSTSMHSELHASICDTFSDADLQEKSDAVIGFTDSEIPNELHPSVCEVPLPDNLHGEGDTVMIECRSIAAIDSDVPNQSDAVPSDSITNLPSDIHPATYDTSADANLQEKHEKLSDSTISDVIIRDSTGIYSEIHASISDSPILNNLLAKSDAVLIQRSVTSLDSDEQNQTDAVLKESSTTNIPCDFHPPLSDSSPDLQEKCETESNVNLDENSNAVVREHNDPDMDSQGHGTLPDSLLNNLHGESEVVMAASNETQLPGNIHPSICHASAEATLQSGSDAVPTENSNVNSSEIVHGSLLDTSSEP